MKLGPKKKGNELDHLEPHLSVSNSQLGRDRLLIALASRLFLLHTLHTTVRPTTGQLFAKVY